MVRRVFGVVASLSMLHLSFVGGDLACADRGGHQQSSVADVHHGMPKHDDDMHHASGGKESPDCPTPSQPHCCDLLAACGLIFDVGRAIEAVPLFSSRVDLPGSNAVVLISRSRGPEPPPPKA
jgi:hypothetical protein